MTDGTPTVVDFQDAYTVTVDLPVLRFDKTVMNVTSGQNPAASATPGDTLRYRIRIENLANNPLPSFDLRDELGRLNTAAVYATGTLNLVTVPAGADASNTNASGGVNNGGIVDIRNLSLGGLGTFVVIEYDVRLVPVLPNQSYVQNQAQAYVKASRSAAAMIRASTPRRIRSCSATKTRRACRSPRARASACSRPRPISVRARPCCVRAIVCATPSRSRTSAPTMRRAFRFATRSP